MFIKRNQPTNESFASLLLLDEGNTGTTKVNQERRILVIDDDLFNLVNLQDMLTTNVIQMPTFQSKFFCDPDLALKEIYKSI